MIPEQEAVKRAWELVNREKIRVACGRQRWESRRDSCLDGRRGDVWEVIFNLNVPPGIARISRRSLLIARQARRRRLR